MNIHKSVEFMAVQYETTRDADLPEFRVADSYLEECTLEEW